MIYIFDIDGTLTPSRNPINPVFKTFFQHFVKNNRVWLVTGSDKDKTIEQLGIDIWSSVERAYQCAGNQLYMNGGELIREHKFELPREYANLLDKFLIQSHFGIRTGNHIEKRLGLTNFSIVGRNCNQKQRDEYYKWDTEFQERKDMVECLNRMYPNIEAAIGGQISIDIYANGKNKSQILDDIHRWNNNYEFFGDHLQPGGNDYPVLERAELENKTEGNSYHSVTCWEDTFEILISKI
jgi:phosphomannomutase